MDLIHEDLKRWGMWSRRDYPPTRPPRCPLGRIAITSQVWEAQPNRSVQVTEKEIWPTELAIRKLERHLQLVLGARYIYLLSFYEPQLQKFFHCSHMTLYRKFDRAKRLVGQHLKNIS